MRGVRALALLSVVGTSVDSQLRAGEPSAALWQGSLTPTPAAALRVAALELNASAAATPQLRLRASRPGLGTR